MALLLFYLEQYRARQLTVETLVTRQAAVGHTLLIILMQQIRRVYKALRALRAKASIIIHIICDLFEI